MSLNAKEIETVATIIDSSLSGSVVREALSERIENRITLVLRGLGENYYLQICIQPEGCRFGRITFRPKCSQSPHPFVMLLRKSIINSKLASVKTEKNDRVVYLSFVRPEKTCFLVCELTSRHSNIFLTDSNFIILGSFLPNRSHRRDLTSGNPYSVPVLRETADKSIDRFSKEDHPENAIFQYYKEKENAAAVEALRNAAIQKHRTAKRKAEKLLDALTDDLRRAEKWGSLQLFGHILKTHLSKITKGDDRFCSEDFEGNEVIIELDPKLSSVENMNRFFDKAGKLKRAEPVIRKRIEATQCIISNLDKEIQRVFANDSASHLSIPSIQESEKNGGLFVPPKKRKVIQERLPYREFTIFSDRIARVGRSAADNDTLTLRHAKPDDLWLHVRGIGGSHVVVPMGRKEDPHPELLIDAAHLAVHFSSLKKQTDVDVLYTRRRYVQKQKGSPPGSVSLLREKSIRLRVEKERLNRILHGEKAF